MERAKYDEALNLAWLIADSLRHAPSFSEAADTATHALDFAPFFNPSLWIEGNGRLQVDRDLFNALATAQRAIAPLIERRLAAEGKAKETPV